MSDKRQTILDTATRLFHDFGYRAVGIDRVIAEAGVAKMTLYKYFPSKTDLIGAVLTERDSTFRESLFKYADTFSDPVERLHAVFTWHDAWFNESAFNGCMFISAAAEFPDGSDAIHQIAKHHKQAILDYLAGALNQRVDTEAAQRLALQLLHIIDGAIVTAHILGDRNCAQLAWRSAHTLIQDETANASQI